MEIEFRACYYVYVLTDEERLSLKVGVTVDLQGLLYPLPDESLLKQEEEMRYLLYYEKYEEAAVAVAREGKLAGFSKRKLKRLVDMNNPEWAFLTDFQAGL